MGDSDSEDDEDEAPVPAPQPSVPRSPLQHSVAAKQATVTPSIADPSPEVDAAAAAGELENGNAAPPSVPAVAVSPVAIDRITQLEDRVR